MSETNNILNKYIINQFNYADYRTMVEIFINLIETLEMKLDQSSSSIQLTSNYGMIFNGSDCKSTTSKIETFLIANYNTEYKIRGCMTKFVGAYNKLNNYEKEIFYYTFFKNTKDQIIIDTLGISNFDLNRVRKSAVIKFSLLLGFDKIINDVLSKEEKI